MYIVGESANFKYKLTINIYFHGHENFINAASSELQSNESMKAVHYRKPADYFVGEWERTKLIFSFISLFQAYVTIIGRNEILLDEILASQYWSSKWKHTYHLATLLVALAIFQSFIFNTGFIWNFRGDIYFEAEMMLYWNIFIWVLNICQII